MTDNLQKEFDLALTYVKAPPKVFFELFVVEISTLVSLLLFVAIFLFCLFFCFSFLDEFRCLLFPCSFD